MRVFTDNAGRTWTIAINVDAIKRIEAGRKLIYAPRPYMGPALEKERPKLPKLWANSVRGG